MRLKGKPLPENAERKGNAYAATINRAKPGAEELSALFEEHISNEALVLCDGLKSYRSLPEATGCTVKDCHGLPEEGKSFFNLNTVNGFHSFIKRLYNFYRGVAIKYLNRYNVLFAAAYTNAEALIKRLCYTLLNVGKINYYHSNRDVRELKLLDI